MIGKKIFLSAAILSCLQGFSLKAFSQMESIQVPPLPRIDAMLGIIHPLDAANGQNCVISVRSTDGTDEGGRYSVTYFDALGREHENVGVGLTPSLKHLATSIEYDALNRKIRQWEPFVIPSSGDAYAPPANVSNYATQTYNGDTSPYTLWEYWECPDERLYGITGPGDAWHNQDKAQETELWSSDDTPSYGYQFLRCLRITANGSTFSVQGYYPRAVLRIMKTTDEDGHISLEFKDRQNRTVLLRRMDGNSPAGFHDTYFVYDGFGLLQAVLPPALSETLSVGSPIPSTSLDKFAYRYEYDEQERMTGKKLPGAAWIYLRYDKGDIPVFTQDGNQRVCNEWTFSLRDAHRRDAVTGICKGIPSNLANLHALAEYTGAGSFAGYAVNLSLDSAQLLTVNYYDNYSFLSQETTDVATALTAANQEGYDTLYSESHSTHGLLTGQRVYLLETIPRYKLKALYYGDRRRVVQEHTVCQIGTFEHEYYSYSFTGKVLKRRHIHSTLSSQPMSLFHNDYLYREPTVDEFYTYTYDHADRLLSVSYGIGNPHLQPMATFQYDELGRVKKKILGLGIDTIQYNYNVRSWPTLIHSAKFHEQLIYNSENYMGLLLSESQKKYNGNIAMSIWKPNGQAWPSCYFYHYDNLNRLTQADYSDGYALSNNIDKYSELYTYDKMGNILTLTRHGDNDVTSGGLVDALSMDYDGNRLVKVSDTVEGPYLSSVMHFQDNADEEVEYEYDANGNMTKDLNRGITKIEYNLLNLPTKITFSDGNTISYLYSATGEKLQILYGSTVQSPFGGNFPLSVISLKKNYAGNLIYSKRENMGFSDITVLTDEGSVSYGLIDTQYHYFLRDHLGSVRAVLDFAGTVGQVNDYYPSGVSFPQSTSTISNSYKFCGKELDRMNGMDWYDSEARFLDVTAGARFTTPDPKAWDYPEVSPYAYGHNNFVNRIDPNGKDDYYTTDGRFIERDNKETDNIIIRNEFLYKMKQATGADWITPDRPITDVTLSAEAYSNIFTDVLSKMGNVDLDDLYNNKVSVTVWKKLYDSNLPVEMSDNFNNSNTEYKVNASIGNYGMNGKQRLTVYIHPEGEEERKLFSSISNVQNLLGIHEYRGHYKNNWKNHRRIFRLQKQHKTWENTTPLFKNYMNALYESY